MDERLIAIQNDLIRFKLAQYKMFAIALEEMEAGSKLSHWMWYIFPQLRGLGYTETSVFFGLNGLEEAKAYYADPLLRSNLLQVTSALLKHKGEEADYIMGNVDAMKLRSSMTLFDLVAPNNVFAEVLDNFFGSERDELTLNMIKEANEDK